MNNEDKGIFEGVSSTLGIVVFGLGMYVLYKNKDSLPTGIGEIPTTFVTFIANMMPFALLAYGIAGDVVNQEGPRLSIPSIAAVGAILVVGIGSQMFATSHGANLSAQDTSGMMWCTIPGLEGVESPYFPTAFMSTAIIGFYYLCWAWHTGRPSTSTLLAFGIVWIAQFATFIFGECQLSYKPLFYGSVLPNILLSTLAGIIIGAISFGSASGNASLSPYNLPGGSASGASGQTGGGGSGNCPPGTKYIGQNRCQSLAGGSPVCESGFSMHRGRCQKPLKSNPGYSQPVQDGGDENTFVAELYKNGQLVTDSIAG
jgi:hypothetical protein